MPYNQQKESKMPCYDPRDHRDYGSSRDSDREAIRQLESRNSALIRTICRIDSTMRFTDAQLNSLGAEAKSIILNHRKFDSKRKAK